MTKFYAFGGCNIAGMELPDRPWTSPLWGDATDFYKKNKIVYEDKCSRLTFSALLADHYKYEYIPVAKSGTTYQEISNDVYKTLAVANPSDSIVYIMWTTPFKPAIKFNNKQITLRIYNGDQPTNLYDVFHQNKDWYGSAPLLEYMTFFKNSYDEEKFYVDYLKDIITTHMFLKSKSFKYCFSLVDNCIKNMLHYLNNNESDQLRELLRLLDLVNYVDFDGQAFLPWCDGMNFKIYRSPYHYDEDANKKIYQYLIKTQGQKFESK